MLKRFFLFIIPITFFVLFFACSSETKKPIDESRKIVFGTTIGDFGDMVKDSIGPQLEKKGYQVSLTEYSEYTIINKSLAEGSIDINVFQHRPYFYYFIAGHHLDLVEVFEVPTDPLGIYAGQLSDLNTDKKEITIGIPNDPTNIARSLLALQDVVFIELDPSANRTFLNLKDITYYNRPIKFIELDAAQLTRSRKKLDFTVINGNYAISSGIDLNSALFQEKGQDYINMAAVRAEDKDTQWVKDVKEAYYSDEFKTYIKRKFKGYIYPEDW
ncbi:MAG: MetQ/NlpA family ABC transporter substrate-binding protein [Neisseriaceae bacterium]|nr:MetQ/NlpA family ABC transporter substrate-binding protein [Neisseriaceae bacterium]MCV2509215.1 MetQ/NlpA family ABC transporter substrate-binding protein [Neisseriaceae bacterium]